MTDRSQDCLRAIYFAHLRELGLDPSIEDWYRFQAATKDLK